MCGICGFIDPEKDAATLEAMSAGIRRRGPDDSGTYLAGGVGLAHRRLSIIDLSPLGHQPMRFGKRLIVFNGEIYNYAGIRDELAALGYGFETSSDTEVILKAFDRWGFDCVRRFIGIFAFAIYDEETRELHLCRDRPGVKPLFYRVDGETIAFGSTLAALKPYLPPDERNEIDPSALSQFLSLGYVGSGRSILKSVRKLPQGHWLTFRGGKVELRPYWDVDFDPEPAWENRSLEDVVDELEALAIDAFKYRMVADVPIGVFLSAGVDSSLVTAILSKHHGQIRTFTIGFEDPKVDEAGQAERIARHLGTDHASRVLTPQIARSILARFHEIYDEPHGDASGIATTFVSELAKDHGVKVVLSGEGGDELFGGYRRYTEFLQRWRQVQRLGSFGRAGARTALAIRGALAGAHRGERWGRQADMLAPAPFLTFMQRRLGSSSSAYLAKLFPAYREQILPPAKDGDLVSQMGEWDFKNYMAEDVLVKIDRATMFHSLEGREPMLDQRLMEFAAKLPSRFKIDRGKTKVALKTLLGRYLPRELYDLPKRGFAPPVLDWVRGDFRAHIADVLSEPAPELDRNAMRGLVDRYRAGKPVNHALIWYLFSYQAWHAKWRAN